MLIVATFMLCKNLENQLPKNKKSTYKILSVQLANSISPLIFNEFQHF